jgi:hypothetical protein
MASLLSGIAIDQSGFVNSFRHVKTDRLYFGGQAGCRVLLLKCNLWACVGPFRFDIYRLVDHGR